MNNVCFVSEDYFFLYAHTQLLLIQRKENKEDISTQCKSAALVLSIKNAWRLLRAALPGIRFFTLESTSQNEFYDLEHVIKFVKNFLCVKWPYYNLHVIRILHQPPTGSLYNGLILSCRWNSWIVGRLIIVLLEV